MKKFIIGIIVLGLFFLASPVEAKTIIKQNGISKITVTTNGNSNVFVSQKVATSSSNVVFKSCSFKKTVSSNGGGTVSVTGDCECK